MRAASCSRPFPADGGVRDHAPLLSACGPGAWARGAHGGQSTGASLQSHLGAPPGPAACQAPGRFTRASARGSEAPATPSLWPLAQTHSPGQPRTDFPQLPTLPRRGQARPSPGPDKKLHVPPPVSPQIRTPAKAQSGPRSLCAGLPLCPESEAVGESPAVPPAGRGALSPAWADNLSRGEGPGASWRVPASSSGDRATEPLTFTA